MNAAQILGHFDRISEAEDAVPRLRRFILDLAVRGKLVSHDPNDEPASELLKRIATEKAQLLGARQVKREKTYLPVTDAAVFDVPASWCWTRLGVVTSYIQRGKSPEYAASSGATVVSQKCVQWQGLNLTLAKQVTLESLAKYEAIRFLRDGDLLWNSTGTGTIGRVVRLTEPPEKLVCDSHVTVVRCLVVDPEYVRIWLRSDHVYALIEDRASGSTNQVELTAQMASGQVLPLPPLAEQHRIVAKVDELMALCDRLEAARAEREATRTRLTTASLARLNAPDTEVANLRRYAGFVLDNLLPLTTRGEQVKQVRQTIRNLAVSGHLVPQNPADESAASLLSRVLERRRHQWEDDRRSRSAITKRSSPGGTVRGYVTPEHVNGLFVIPNSWSWASTLEVCAAVENGNTPAAEEMSEGHGDIPYIKVYNLTKTGALDMSIKPTFITRRVHETQLKRSRIVPGDVLMNIVGPPLGKVALVPDEFPEWNTNQAVVILRPSFGVLSKYLATCLLSTNVLSWITRLAQATVGQSNISVSKSRLLPIPLPPLAEQQRIVAKVDELMTLCDRLEASLARGEERRGRLLEALLHEALAPTLEEAA